MRVYARAYNNRRDESKVAERDAIRAAILSPEGARDRGQVTGKLLRVSVQRRSAREAVGGIAAIAIVFKAARATERIKPLAVL